MFFQFFIYLTLLFSIFACKGESKQLSQPLTMHISSADSVLWIDVRSQSEYESGHLPEAIHIPYQIIGEKIANVTNSKKQRIKLYCSVGGRSGVAKATLTRLGYTNVTNEGGYSDILQRRK